MVALELTTKQLHIANQPMAFFISLIETPQIGRSVYLGYQRADSRYRSCGSIVRRRQTIVAGEEDHESARLMLGCGCFDHPVAADIDRVGGQCEDATQSDRQSNGQSDNAARSVHAAGDCRTRPLASAATSIRLMNGPMVPDAAR